MAHANNMTNLVNKIERRLGLMPLTPHLPEKYGKDAWAEVIKDQTITTFSRYFPWKVPFVVTEDVPKRNGWYIIDEEKYFGQTGVLLGIQDIDWNDFSSDNLSVAQISGYGNYIDFYGSNISFEDIMCHQMRADAMSLMNYGIYIEYREPNMFRLSGLTNQMPVQMRRFTVNVLLKHPDSLQTISPTKMETFEELAKADVAEFLSSNLRFWDQMDTVFATIDMKLGDIDNAASKRDQIIEKLESSYVTAANDSIPFMICV
jgi:hypothetical protein